MSFDSLTVIHTYGHVKGGGKKRKETSLKKPT